MAAPVESSVTASDASLSRHAVCWGTGPQEEVAQHGRILERTRFTRNPGASPRDFPLSLKPTILRWSRWFNGIPVLSLSTPVSIQFVSQVELKAPPETQLTRGHQQ